TGPASGPRPASSTPAIGPPCSMSSMASSSKVAIMVRIACAPLGQASRVLRRVSKEGHLAALRHGALESIAGQLMVPLVQVQAFDRQSKSGANLLGVRALAALAHAPLGRVVLAAVHAAQNVDDSGGAIGELGLQ